jgi:hypothetical protein
MLFHHLGDNYIVVYPKADNISCRQLRKLNFKTILCQSQLTPKYPNDIALNAARILNYCLCNEKFIDSAIIEYLRIHKIQIVPIKQGYAKCSIAIVDEKSIITADEGITNAANKLGLDVLKIREGYINLHGYNFGFIGGCCGKLGKDTLAFCGKINKHPDFKEIRNFCDVRGIKIIELTSQPLTDIGGIIPLIEE